MATNLERRVASLESTRSDAVVLTLIEHLDAHTAPDGSRMLARFGSTVHHATQGETESDFCSRLTKLADAERRAGTGPVRIIVQMTDLDL